MDLVLLYGQRIVEKSQTRAQERGTNQSTWTTNDVEARPTEILVAYRLEKAFSPYPRRYNRENEDVEHDFKGYLAVDIGSFGEGSCRDWGRELGAGKKHDELNNLVIRNCIEGLKVETRANYTSNRVHAQAVAKSVDADSTKHELDEGHTNHGLRVLLADLASVEHEEADSDSYRSDASVDKLDLI